MTFNAPSFFAGVGTVLACLVVGFGGGILISGVLTDGTREPNKIERRAAAETKPSTSPVVVASPAPVAPAQTQAQEAAAPVPAAQSAEPAKSPEPVQPQAEPQSPAQPLPRPQVPPPPPPQIADQTPPLGAERAVSLVQPVGQEQARERAREQARVPPAEVLPRRLEAGLEAERRKAERRKLKAERRLEQQMRKEKEIRAAAERSRRLEADDDDDDARDERPLFTQRDRLFEPPPFRFFGNN